MLLRIEADIVRVENPSDCVSLRLEGLAILTPDILVRRIKMAVPDDNLAIEVIAWNVLVCDGEPTADFGDILADVSIPTGRPSAVVIMATDSIVFRLDKEFLVIRTADGVNSLHQVLLAVNLLQR